MEQQRRSDQALAAIQRSMQEVEDAHRNDLNNADTHLRDKLGDLSEAQRSIMAMQDAVDEAGKANRRAIGAQRLGDVLHAWMRGHQQRALNKWRLLSRVEAERERSANELNSAAQDRLARADEERAAALLAAARAAADDQERAVHEARQTEIENAVQAVAAVREEQDLAAAEHEEELERARRAHAAEMERLHGSHTRSAGDVLRAAEEREAELARRAEAERDEAVAAARAEGEEEAAARRKAADEEAVRLQEERDEEERAAHAAALEEIRSAGLGAAEVR